jgi:phosphate/sulfate permease
MRQCAPTGRSVGRHSLQPGHAVVWSGFMNFVGVLVGGIAVAYALLGRQVFSGRTRLVK